MLSTKLNSLKSIKQIILNFKYPIKGFSSKFKHSNLSICSGPTGVRLLETSIGETLKSIAQKFPYVDAIISGHQKRKISYEEFNFKVDKVVMSLIALNLPEGAKIGVYAPNCEEWVLTQMACGRAGFILVNINPAYQVSDLKYVLNKVGVNILIMPRILKSSSYIEILTTIAPSIRDSNQIPSNLKLKEMPELKGVILLEDSTCGEMFNSKGISLNITDKSFYHNLSVKNNLITWDDFYNRQFPILNENHKDEHFLEHDFLSRKANVNVDDPVNIQFTSGTTGLPKGAVLSHYNILNNGFLVGRTLEYSEKDKVVIGVPLYHCFGAVLGNLACITHGATMIYPNGTFDGVKSLEMITTEKATSLYGVPTMFLDILNWQQKLNKDISSLRKGIMAGSVCPQYLMHRCIKELNMTDLTICYGMTELSPVSHQTTPYDTFERRTTTVGTLLPHTITKIVDEEGKIVERNIAGEICTKSYGLMLGYLADPKATSEAIDKDGFMKTGDTGFIDNDGYLHIQGRKKDTIIRGGENISPKELEEYIGTHAMIDDVQVISAKDEKFGEEVCAWIKVKENFQGKVKKEDIIAYCKKQIAHYKIPRYVRFVDSFPMTVNGKPLKHKMRDITNQILQDKSEEI